MKLNQHSPDAIELIPETREEAIRLKRWSLGGKMTLQLTDCNEWGYVRLRAWADAETAETERQRIKQIVNIDPLSQYSTNQF